jgi:hypothetical protein
MKTTIDIPDPVLDRARSKAAELGISLSQFVSGAVEHKLGACAPVADKPWMKHVGKLKHLRKETQRINKLIEERFEHI